MVLDKDRITKNKSDILNVKSQIENIIAVDNKETFLSDKRNALSLKYLLVEAVEAISDVSNTSLQRQKAWRVMATLIVL
ncbi:MAG: hypothetical protein Q8N09_06310 [Thermodesulfovibrionia bacterium]|nr:hypothetical protein [Thermodesulfovibrionia bacterium]